MVNVDATHLIFIAKFVFFIAVAYYLNSWLWQALSKLENTLFIVTANFNTNIHNTGNCPTPTAPSYDMGKTKFKFQ